MTREDFDMILDGWTGYNHETDMQQYCGCFKTCPNKTGYPTLDAEGQRCCLDDKVLRDALWEIVERAAEEDAEEKETP